MTNARHKLNAASINGGLFLAGLTAFVAQSWPLFWILLIATIGTSMMSGDIRLTGQRK